MTLTPLAPTADQALLLRAALAPVEDARPALDAWRGRQIVDDVDGPEYRVLGLLAARLGELGGEDLAPRLESVRRATWLRTNALFRNVAPVVAALREAEIPVMLGKGAAVLAHTGWRSDERPMDDIDVVVPFARVAESVAILREHGFACALLPPDAAATRIYEQTHAVGFWDRAGACIDLHWHVLHGSLHARADDAFWEAARPVDFRGTACLALCPEDTFLQVVAHGQEMTVRHPLRWAADAVLLLRAAGPGGFDWDRLIALSRAHRLGRGMGLALTTLDELDPSLVPPAVLAASRPSRRRLVERRARGLAESPWAGPLAPTREERLSEDVREWLRRSVAPGARATPSQAGGFLAESFGLERGAGRTGAPELARHAAWLASGRRARRLAPCDAPALGAPLVGIPYGLHFTAGEVGAAFLTSGWWAPDDHGTWSRGREAVLAFGLETRHTSPLHLRFTVVPYLAPTRPHLEVDVYERADRVARWGFSAVGPVEEGRDVTLPADPARDTLALRFVVRSPISPQTARVDADPRPLGIALRAVLVTEAR